MTEETNGRRKLQWHLAFFAEIQIELLEDADKLIFENEHQLGTKPMEIDVLIIKKQRILLLPLCVKGIPESLQSIWKLYESLRLFHRQRGFIISWEECFPCS